VILYYLLVSGMPLARHPLWADFLGDLTVIKYVGLGCVLYMVVHLFQRRTPPRFLDTWQARWFWGLTALSTVSYLTIGSPSAIRISPLMNYISFAVFFFITVVVIDSRDRLHRVGIGVFSYGAVPWPSGAQPDGASFLHRLFPADSAGYHCRGLPRRILGTAGRDGVLWPAVSAACRDDDACWCCAIHRGGCPA
jgi:hypothetical protein